MDKKRRAFLGIAGWAVSITGLHWKLNVDWLSVINDRLPESERKLRVAYIPVT